MQAIRWARRFRNRSPQPALGMANFARFLRGGKRPGSGRKPRAFTRTTLLLSPEARAKLEEIAAGHHATLSATAEKAIMAMPAK